jgi:hypothetical protein
VHQPTAIARRHILGDKPMHGGDFGHVGGVHQVATVLAIDDDLNLRIAKGSFSLPF